MISNNKLKGRGIQSTRDGNTLNETVFSQQRGGGIQSETCKMASLKGIQSTHGEGVFSQTTS